MRIVVDTNVVFAALLGRESRLREALLTDAEHAFYSPRFVMVEIFKHKERIAAASQLGSDEITLCPETHSAGRALSVCIQPRPGYSPRLTLAECDSI